MAETDGTVLTLKPDNSVELEPVVSRRAEPEQRMRQLWRLLEQ